MQQFIPLSKTGIDEIDRQHTQLIKCLDDLLKFVDTDYSYSASLTAIVALMNYTKEHFAYEEKLLAECAYPLLDKHIDEHKVISDDVMQYWSQIEAGAEIGKELVHAIRHWIIDHINAEDMEFADYLAGQN